MADLKSRLCSPAAAPAVPQGDWLSAISGSMKDEPDFAEVVRLGRAIRGAGIPADDGEP